jgi:hypothetical protein
MRWTMLKAVGDRLMALSMFWRAAVGPACSMPTISCAIMATASLIASGTAGRPKTAVTCTARTCAGQTDSTPLFGTSCRKRYGLASEPSAAFQGPTQKCVPSVSVSLLPV